MNTLRISRILLMVFLMLFCNTQSAFAAWRTGTAMSAARQEFTMITLGNGKTLAAGGWNGSAYTSTAELYDPATGLWTATGSMNGIRGGESEAVLLQDGRVLLVGGSGTGGGVNVEIYDPVAGTWSVTGSMNVSRRQFSINVLNDGRVLVAGSSACVSSAEIYNPATGTWTLTGSMINGRRYNVGALLTNGNVITVNGRIHDCTALGLTISETTELYNVATGTWSSTGNTVIERQKHRIVTLLNGTPMVVGGGQDNLDTTPIAELYDVNTGTWTATGSMTAKKADFEMKVLPNGKVIMAGGTTLGSSTNQTNTSEIYDPTAGTWSSAGTFTTVRYFHRSAVLADGSFMIGGGNSGSTTLSSVNIYSIPPVSTTQAASSVTATTATLNGTITHTGGQTPTVRGFNYGTTTGYGTNTTENGSFSTGAYTANITGLTCGTTYHYRTYATNTEGTDYSSDATFTTGSCDSTAPTISEVTPITTPTTDSTPNYTFTTDEAGTITYGGSCTSSTTSASIGSNTITFSSLADGNYSNCTVTVTDAASNASTPMSVTSFSVDTNAPVLSSILASVTTTTATITWTTDEASSSSVSYGSTDSYGSTTTEIDTSTRVTSHNVTISGLNCASMYHYKVISKDLAGNTSVANDNTFTTTTCPVVSRIQSSGSSASSIITNLINMGKLSEAQKYSNQFPNAVNSLNHEKINTPKPQVFVTIKKGLKNNTVKYIQEKLKVLPYDGSFGPKTFKAVKDFQAKNNLASDGIVGPKTWALLK
jgi:hypothetical protein